MFKSCALMCRMKAIEEDACGLEGLGNKGRKLSS